MTVMVNAPHSAFLENTEPGVISLDSSWIVVSGAESEPARPFGQRILSLKMPVRAKCLGSDRRPSAYSIMPACPVS